MLYRFKSVEFDFIYIRNRPPSESADCRCTKIVQAHCFASQVALLSNNDGPLMMCGDKFAWEQCVIKLLYMNL